MTDSTTPAAAIERWRRDTEELQAALNGFSATAWDARSENEGWTNRQVLMHIATGYTVRVAVLRAVLDGKPLPEIDADAVNAELLDQWGDAPPGQLIQEMVRNRRQVLTLLHSLRDRHLDAQVPLRGGPRLGDALLLLSEHDLEHVAQLRPAPPNPTPPA